MTASGLPVVLRREVWNVIEGYAGLWSFSAIGRHVGLAARTVENYCRRAGVRPTEYQGWWTSGVAAEFVGCTAQRLTALARAGRVHARRNASYSKGKRRRQDRYRPNARGWWMFDPADLERLKRGRSSRPLDIT